MLQKTAIGFGALAFIAYYYQNSLRSFLPNNINNLANEFTSLQGGCSEAYQYLTDVHPVLGFHVVCMTKTDDNIISGIAFLNGMNNSKTFESTADIQELKKKLEDVLEIKRPNDEHARKYKQPWGIFTPDGVRLSEPSEIVNRVIYVFEGGQFIWPGVKVGHKIVVKDLHDRGDVTLETLSMIPLVFSVENFLKDEEIDIIKELSIPHMYNSGVAHNDNDVGRPATDWRTSTQYFLSSDNASIKSIDQRTAELVKIPRTHQEYVQVLRYEETQKYDAHNDFFSIENHRQNPSLLETIEYGYKNRLATVFWYMTDVEEGGETNFPMAGGLPPPIDFTDCSKGLSVFPVKRRVIIFYSMLPNGDTDEYSLHAGCPVKKGVKWAANKWVWNKPREFVR